MGFVRHDIQQYDRDIDSRESFANNNYCKPNLFQHPEPNIAFFDYLSSATALLILNLNTSLWIPKNNVIALGNEEIHSNMQPPYTCAYEGCIFCFCRGLPPFFSF